MSKPTKSADVSSPTCAALLYASLEGDVDMYIARETAKRLNKELEESGNDTFSIGDLRRIRNGVFGA